jgi:ssDNA-binding Zn-finger/Zn-ribbon topoisomerase 1
MGIRCEFCGTSADKIIQNQPISNVPIKASLGKNANFDFKKEKPIQNLRTLQKGDPFYCSKHKLQKVLNEEGTLYECPDCSKPLIPQCPTHRVGMILKNGRYGPFYGCPTFPKCKETRDAPNPINKNFMQ